MLRSLYSAVSGIKAHQTYLDVTGNNIANVNTTGFKRDATLFADAIYQTIKNASAPNSAIPVGGVNPSQVGLGVSIASIETMHIQGSTQNTGSSTDMAISGEGFFVVNNGGQQLYTRAGAFSIDAVGGLVMQGSGYPVMGYAFRDQLNKSTGIVERVKDPNLTEINIPIGEKIPAKETQLVSFRCNLCSSESKEITDLENIPGGDNQIARPHAYQTYEIKEATWVGSTKLSETTEIKPSDGDTWYDGGDKLQVWKEDPADKKFKWMNVCEVEIKKSDVYYGKNTSYTAANAEPFDEIFYGYGGSPEGPVLDSNITIDSFSGEVNGHKGPPENVYEAGCPVPSLCKPPITRTGQTYLDTATGHLYTTTENGMGWVMDKTKTPEEAVWYANVVTDTVYVSGKSGELVTPDPKKPFTYDGDGKYVSGSFEDIDGMLKFVDGEPNIFQWDVKRYQMSNINAMGLSPTANSTTTQETIDAFGKSMIASYDHPIKFTVYDSLGNPRTLEIAMRKVLDRPAYPNAVPEPLSAEAEWDWYAYYLDADGNVLEQYGEGAGTLVFGADGLLKRTYYYEPTPATPNPAATATTQPEYNWTVVEKIIGDPAYDNVATGKVVADFNVSGAEGSVVDGQPVTYSSNTITLDFLGKLYADQLGIDHDTIDGVTQFASETTTKMRYQDGYPMGTLTNFSVGQDGTITGIYDNDQTLPIARVALATFANQQGLEKVGGTCYAATVNSGVAQIGDPLMGSAGGIVSQSVEMSNVDLSEEFVNLIRAQRGFQANSRVVTTSDQILEELINLKR